MPEVNDSGIAYLALKAAQKLYGKAPSELPSEEMERVQALAHKQSALEARVLASPEAGDAMVPQASVQAALQEIMRRYADAEEFHADLASNGLDEEGLTAALQRELKVEAILEKVGTRAEKVSDADVARYYEEHPEQFRRPETRLARHILITINDAYPENTRAHARKRIEAIAADLLLEPGHFVELALKHSECPTALEGGKLGDLPAGKLFPQLDEVLFELKTGEISGVLESEIGFHLLRCDMITEARTLELSQASPKIRKALEGMHKRAVQQAWLKKLVKT